MTPTWRATQRGSEQAPAQFNTDRTHPGRGTIPISTPPINMFVPTPIVENWGGANDLTSGGGPHHREGRSVPVGES